MTSRIGLLARPCALLAALWIGASAANAGPGSPVILRELCGLEPPVSDLNTGTCEQILARIFALVEQRPNEMTTRLQANKRELQNFLDAIGGRANIGGISVEVQLDGTFDAFFLKGNRNSNVDEPLLEFKGYNDPGPMSPQGDVLRGTRLLPDPRTATVVTNQFWFPDSIICLGPCPPRDLRSNLTVSSVFDCGAEDQLIKWFPHPSHTMGVTRYQIQEAPVGTTDWNAMPMTPTFPGLTFDASTFGVYRRWPMSGYYYPGTFDFEWIGDGSLAFTRVAPRSQPTVARIRACEGPDCGEWSEPVYLDYAFCVPIW